jgi:hypothetical protein
MQQQQQAGRSGGFFFWNCSYFLLYTAGCIRLLAAALEKAGRYGPALELLIKKHHIDNLHVILSSPSDVSFNVRQEGGRCVAGKSCYVRCS